MKNIFENAYFGKPYKTRDNRKALYHSYNNFYPNNPYKLHHNLILEKPYEDSLWIYCNDYGHTEEHINGEWLNVTNSDIVSEWEESISEEELDRIADELNPNNPHGDTYEVGQYFGFQDGVKAVYRKAIM